MKQDYTYERLFDDDGTELRAGDAVCINGNIHLDIEQNIIGELVIPVADGVVIHSMEKK